LRTRRTSNPLTLGVALRVVAVLLIAGIATIGQAGLAEATASVPPETYAAAICGAVATMHSDAVAAEASLKAATQAYKDQPTQDTATQLRHALVDYLQQYRAFLGDALTAFQKAGVPAGKNGVRFARSLNKNLQTTTAALDPLIQQASAIDVTSTAAFATGVQDVFARVTAASNTSKKQARQDAAFKGVPAALHPIVSYARGGSNTCPAN
jgi:hypothetical protein